MPKSSVFRPLGWTLLAVVLGCNSAVVAEALNPSAPTTKADPNFQLDVRESVTYLASDELEGRGLGTKGLDKAADYVAGNFKKLGLQPAPGLDGYFQNFAITRATAPDPATTLTFGEKTYALEDDFGVVSFSAEGKFDGEVVFAGYGVTSKRYGYDDYADIDVKGKVALVLRYEPHDANGVSRFTKNKGEWSESASLIAKVNNAAKHGATAVLIVNPPTFHEDVAVPFSREMMSEKASIPFLFLKRHVAKDLLAKAQAKPLAELQKQIDDGGEPHGEVLADVKVAGQVKILRKDTPVKNVVGVIPGKGELAKEYVVVGAHYDHLGKGGPGSLTPNRKEIHNGADDNASGTTAMMKIAEHFARSGSADARSGSADARAGSSSRSLMFVAFTAEEEGLIGSAKFVERSPVPVDRIAYMINLDMVGRVRNESLSVGGTMTAPSFKEILKKADDDSPLDLKELSKGGIGPSDHMTFAKKKVPVLFFWSGNHGDYHRPTDDADKVNYDGIAQVVKFSTNVVDALLAHPREQYVATYDHGGMGRPWGAGGRRVPLGVVPDYGNDADRGVRISGTVPGSPAEKAGLKEGDLILKWDDTDVASLYTLTDLLKSGKPGQKVKLVVVRGGKNVDVEATLAERKG
jgi:hypothetical protein